MDEQSVYQIPARKIAAHRGMLFSGSGFLVTWLMVLLTTTGALGAVVFFSSHEAAPPTLKSVIEAIGFLPLYALWFSFVLLFHVFALKSRLAGVSADREKGPVLISHFNHARELLAHIGPKMRDYVPQKHSIKAIIVEGKRRLAHVALPTTALVLLSCIFGVYSLFHLVRYEGLAGLVCAKVIYFLGLLALLAGGVLHGQSCLICLLIPLLWFGMPLYLTHYHGFDPVTHGLIDGLLFVPLLVISLRMLSQLRESGNERMLAIGPSGLFLGLPAIDGSIKTFEVEVNGLIDVREEIDGYTAYIPVERGRPVRFFFHSRAELEKFASVGPKEARGALARMSNGSTYLAILLGFTLAAVALGGVTVFAGLIIIEDAKSAEKPLIMRRPGLTGEARVPMVQRSSLVCDLALGRIHRSIIAFQDERFIEANELLEGAYSWAGGQGIAGRMVKAAKDGGYGVFCTRAAESLALADKVQIPEGHDPIAYKDYYLAKEYAEILADVTPQFPPGELYYDLVIRHLRKAISSYDDNVPAEVEWLLALVLGLQHNRLNIDLPNIDRVFLESWALESRRVRNRLEGKVDERELARFDARNLFRDELFTDSITLLKRVGGTRGKLLMASAARFTGTNLAFHLKRVRQIGKDSIAFAVEAKMLEALILGQMGKAKEAKKILLSLGGDYIKGFQARFLNILVLNQAKLPTPRTGQLEPKMRKSLGIPYMRVGALPWPEWIARVDLEYLAAIRGRRDRKMLERLSNLPWYPWKHRAKAHYKQKGKTELGLRPGDVTAFQYQGYVVQTRK